MNNKTPTLDYMIGQRVIYNNVICVVCKPENNYSEYPWIDNPGKGYKHFVYPDNLKPLPNGQL